MIPKKTRYRLPWPLEDTDAAVHRHLSDLADLSSGQFTFEREQVTQSSVVYKLSYPEFYPNADSLGKFELFRRPDGDTGIEITGPAKPPTRQFSKEEGESLDAVPPEAEEYREKVGQLLFEIDQERKTVLRRRISLQEKYVSQLLARLRLDPALPEREPSSVGEITDDSETADQTVPGVQPYPEGIESGYTIDEIMERLPSVQTMRQFYADYTPKTAAEIIKKIPQAWALYSHEGGRWGPGYIEKVYGLTSATIGRYLKALKEAGIREVDGIEIP